MARVRVYTIEIATKEKKFESGRKAGRQEKGQRKEGMVQEKQQRRRETEKQMRQKRNNQ